MNKINIPELITYLKREHAIASKDADKTADVSEAMYHLGRVDALEVLLNTVDRAKGMDNLEDFFDGYLETHMELMQVLEEDQE